MTQDQLQGVQNQVTDLRVSVAGLTGELKVTNQRLNDLIDGLEKSNGNRKWFIATAIGSIGLFLTVVGLIFRASL